MHKRKILIIGEIYVDQHLDIKENGFSTSRLGGIFHAARSCDALNMEYALAYAQSMGIKDVYAAFINSNHAKEIDCSMEFFAKLESLLYEYGSIRINMPFREMTKTEVAKLGLDLKAPIEITYSCQVNAEMPCGACPNCVDRITALNIIIEGKNNE